MAKRKVSAIFNLANFFIALNLLCGLIGTWLAWKNNFDGAIIAVVLGSGFDVVDGRVARWLAKKFGVVGGKFGAYFDDVADFITFGIAPAMLIWAYCGRSPESAVVALFYLFCVARRLIYFIRQKDATPAGFFFGVPSPAGAAIVGFAALAGWPSEAIVAATIISAELMVKFDRVWPHFNFIVAIRRNKLWWLNLVAVAIGATAFAVIFESWRAAPFGAIIAYLATPLWQQPPERKKKKTAT
ncbi:MAG: CDP-alcohol phosphatidyltransferase family protein [Candidatus Peribacteraceae bacterium]|nr:CDP-alcohol phosphatidyltransferase family protein [Candidatus Peribacteraceae bacterium]